MRIAGDLIYVLISIRIGEEDLNRTHPHMAILHVIWEEMQKFCGHFVRLIYTWDSQEELKATILNTKLAIEIWIGGTCPSPPFAHPLMNVQRCLQSLFEQLSDMHTHSTHNRPLHVAVYEKLYRKVFGAYVDLSGAFAASEARNNMGTSYFV